MSDEKFDGLAAYDTAVAATGEPNCPTCHDQGLLFFGEDGDEQPCPDCDLGAAERALVAD